MSEWSHMTVSGSNHQLLLCQLPFPFHLLVGNEHLHGGRVDRELKMFQAIFPIPAALLGVLDNVEIPKDEPDIVTITLTNRSGLISC